MRKVRRLMQLAQWARESRKMCFEELCDRLSVSPATLKRDLRYLREDLGVQLAYDHHERCYVLRAPEPRSAFEVRGLWVHDDDLFALCLAQRMIEDSGLADGVATRLGRLLRGLQGSRNASGPATPAGDSAAGSAWRSPVLRPSGPCSSRRRPDDATGTGRLVP